MQTINISIKSLTHSLPKGIGDADMGDANQLLGDCVPDPLTAERHWRLKSRNPFREGASIQSLTHSLPKGIGDEGIFMGSLANASGP